MKGQDPVKNKAVVILGCELFVTVGLFVVVTLLSAKYQPMISRQEGRPWEAVHYYKIAEDLSKGRRPEGPGPWISRIGASFLASVLPGKDLMQNFLRVNIIANALAALLLLLWLRLFISSWKIRLLLMLLFLLPFNSPTRRVFYAPVSIDHWDKVFFLGGMIVIHKLQSSRAVCKILSMTLITGIGVMFRGITILVGLSLLFVHNPIGFDRETFTFRIKKWPPKIFYLPLLAGVLGIVFCNEFTISETSTYASMRMMGRVIYQMLLSTYVLGWFVAYGPILALVVYNWRSSLKFLMENQYQFIILLSVIIIAWLGGNSVNRYALWALPIMYVLIGRTIEEHSREMRTPVFICVLAISQVIAQRVFMIWPDFPSSAPERIPIFTPLGNNVRLFDVIGIEVSQSNFIALSQYLLFSLAVVLYLYYRARKLRIARPLREAGDDRTRSSGAPC
jgi:hypothetical protein